MIIRERKGRNVIWSVGIELIKDIYREKRTQCDIRSVISFVSQKKNTDKVHAGVWLKGNQKQHTMRSLSYTDSNANVSTAAGAGAGAAACAGQERDGVGRDVIEMEINRLHRCEIDASDSLTHHRHHCCACATSYQASAPLHRNSPHAHRATQPCQPATN